MSSARSDTGLPYIGLALCDPVTFKDILKGIVNIWFTEHHGTASEVAIKIKRKFSTFYDSVIVFLTYALALFMARILLVLANYLGLLLVLSWHFLGFACTLCAIIWGLSFPFSRQGIGLDRVP